MTSPRRALVTGITGQDGSYLVERLLDEGTVVHGMVRSTDPEADALRTRLPQVVLHEGDLADTDRLRAVVAEAEPDEIYNLAGISSVARSWEEPELTASLSGVAVAALLDAAYRLQGASGRRVRFLQASSAEIFGAPTDVPQDERTAIAPVTPYGAAKAFAHHLVGVYRGRELHASACILYNHESPRRPATFVTRKITQVAAQIGVTGSGSLSLGNLDARRDWGWAPDYVDAMVRAVRHPTPDDYVIATGESHSVREFVEAAFRRAGVTDWRSYVEFDEGLTRPVEAHELRGDSTKARRVLGWQPTIRFEELVERMVDHDMDIERGEA